MHAKTFGDKTIQIANRQPLTGTFKGAVHLGAYKGHGAKAIGAVCDPDDFSGIVEVAPNVLGPRDGAVLVDVVEPGHQPIPYEFGSIVQQEVFSDAPPWVVIRVVKEG
jgi:hypothetical protein